MPFFEHDGLQFHYRDEGTGLPFFFQHGLGADVSQPFSLFRPPPGIRLIAFDCRAHGQTHPVGDHNKVAIAQFADDLAALMDYLKISDAVLGGISMGAAVTLNFTLRYPDFVRGLILSRPAWTDGPHPWNVRIFTLIAGLVREHGRKRGQELFRETPEYKEALVKWPDVAESLAGQFDHPDVEQTVFKLQRIISDSPCRDLKELTAIRVPTLIIVNDLDPVHPIEFGPILARAIPKAELREITSKSISLPAHERDVQAELDRYFQTHFLQ